ncbi:hypothetical protein CCR75_005051 [Bremia lactucae]|uniref:BSD domain-containing protein n=1 Tax=Bremia lactucae TaxID=4779 RepID=A0A976IET0_BRELC|nr:hypothetical protein CCR75_005051 [Bremia lactucae]
MAARMSEFGLSAVRVSEIGMRHSAANLHILAGSVANKAQDFASVLSRVGGRKTKSRRQKSVPTSNAENELSPMSQEPELPEPEAEVPKAESALEKPQLARVHEGDPGQYKEVLPLLPWEMYTDDGRTHENTVVKRKILELAIYRRTFAEPAPGEEEYVFDFDLFKGVARELLLSDPNLREKRETLVESLPNPVITEEIFWRNFFLRCNAVRLAESMPSYLPEVKHMASPTGPFAMLKRGFFGKKKNLDFWPVSRFNTSTSKECGLELDVDGEIEKELVKRRPSRAVELHLQPVSRVEANDGQITVTDIALKVKKQEIFLADEAKCKKPGDIRDANSPNKAEEPEEHAPILV